MSTSSITLLKQWWLSTFFSSYSLKLSVCPSLQSFLSLVNLLSSSQSVWKLLGQQPLANKSKYTLREMPTSVPVSIFHTMRFTFSAIPISAIWGHVCTFYFAANHTAFIFQAMPSLHIFATHSPVLILSLLYLCCKILWNYTVLCFYQVVPILQLPLYSTGFDRQADSC